jgi:serine/threonine protein kinase
VSDFGLTVNAYTATYKYVSGGPKPIRYLAPEALRRGRYSEKSDVWAFGVTVWELLSGGDIPFFDITDDDQVVRHVVGGGVLPPPESPAALPLWAAVRPCFAQQPKDRPTFAQLAVTLGSGIGAEPAGAPTPIVVPTPAVVPTQRPVPPVVAPTPAVVPTPRRVPPVVTPTSRPVAPVVAPTPRPTAAPPAPPGTVFRVENCGRACVNGNYHEDGEENGKTRYRNGENNFILF